MNEDTIRLVTIGRILRRRWRLLAVLAALGALFGYGTSVLVFPPRYTASAPVLLPGVWEERELLTQVDIATSLTVVDRTADALHWSDVSSSELRHDVSASAGDGNIITISGTADTPERAQQLADGVAQQFVQFAAQVAGSGTDSSVAAQTEALRKQVAETNRRISDLADAADPGQTVESVQSRTALENLRTSLEAAMKKLEEADPSATKSGMVVMGQAARPTGEAPPTRIQLIAGGALLFFLLTVVGHLVAARMNRRLRTEPAIAAALGSTPLGAVDVAGDWPAHRSKGSGRGARIGRLLGTDTRWDEPAPQKSGDEAGRRLRYRRVCARLREQLPAPRRLLVVVPDGDEIARKAAGQLLAEAKNDPQLRVVEVSVDRPIVPDRGTENGAVVVLSANSWTAEELAGIAEACAEGRHDVVGVVVAGPVQAGSARAAADLPDDATLTFAVPGRATGGRA
ncbi:Wzz/FepE/Etk N-terminal domain-containing protein [Streptomyces griseorubiginosus]|uniref:Wzz/FepE/Etk N-terminal domain-containing protein n=1 Tax=Streptomyces griseorubiginosus TaxID=67304 RepID=UPI00113FDD1E|nr:Wzz/FepE/Etk N-terminal domain-containing protein [Streptomyces griseorubiginosus]